MAKNIPDKLLLIINSSSRTSRQRIADSISLEEASIFMKNFSKGDIDEFLRSLCNSGSIKPFKTSYDKNWRAPAKAVLSRCYNSFYIYIPSDNIFITLCTANPPVTIQYL